MVEPTNLNVDAAAEDGGNCELTKPDEVVEHGGVIIYGPLSLPSTLPTHASEMFSKNIVNFINILTKDGKTIEVDFSDEILREACITHKGQIRLGGM